MVEATAECLRVAIWYMYPNMIHFYEYSYLYQVYQLSRIGGRQNVTTAILPAVQYRYLVVLRNSR